MNTGAANNIIYNSGLITDVGKTNFSFGYPTSINPPAGTNYRMVVDFRKSNGNHNFNNKFFTLDNISITHQLSINELACTSYSDYRYGVNGMEKDDEVKGGGNSYTSNYRSLDPRLGRWLSIDPVVHYGVSPYSTFDNNPITIADPSGADGNEDGEGENSMTKEHTVQAGETLTGIAKKHGVSINDIKRVNGGGGNWTNDTKRSGDQKDWVYVGETLKIPNLTKTQVESSAGKLVLTTEQGEVLGKVRLSLADYQYWHGEYKLPLTDEEREKGGFFAYVWEDNGLDFLGHAMIVNLDNGDVYEANHPTIDGKVVSGGQSAKNGGPKSQFYKHNIYDSKFWSGVKQERGVLNFHVLWINDKAALIKTAENDVQKTYDYHLLVNNCKSYVISLIRTGQSHREANLLQEGNNGAYYGRGYVIADRPSNIHTPFDYQLSR